jgi:hypothetical protein
MSLYLRLRMDDSFWESRFCFLFFEVELERVFCINIRCWLAPCIICIYWKGLSPAYDSDCRCCDRSKLFLPTSLEFATVLAAAHDWDLCKSLFFYYCSSIL